MSIIDDVIGAVTSTTSLIWPKPSEKPRLEAGKLRPCPGTPNCVCSEGASPGGHVEPLPMGDSESYAWKTLKEVVVKLGGKIEEESAGYLWATFMVPIAGFTDDVEFRADAAAKVIHVRSSSRLGFSDLGVNRSRVEHIRETFRRFI